MRLPTNHPARRTYHPAHDQQPKYPFGMRPSNAPLAQEKEKKHFHSNNSRHAKRILRGTWPPNQNPRKTFKKKYPATINQGRCTRVPGNRQTNSTRYWHNVQRYMSGGLGLGVTTSTREPRPVRERRKLSSRVQNTKIALMCTEYFTLSAWS